jgi:hypothetical protein
MASDLLLQTITLTKDRPVLSSERAPHKDKTVTVKQGLDTKTDWLTVSRNVTLTFVFDFENQDSRSSDQNRKRPEWSDTYAVIYCQLR